MKKNEIANILPQKKEVSNVVAAVENTVMRAPAGATLSECVAGAFNKSAETIATELSLLNEYSEKRKAFADFVTEMLFVYYQKYFGMLTTCDAFASKKSASEMKRLHDSLKGVVDDSQIDAIVAKSCGQSAKQLNLAKQFSYFCEKNGKKQFLSVSEFSAAFNKSCEELRVNASELAQKEYTEKRIKKAIEDAQTVFGTLDKKQSDAIKANTRKAIAEEIASGKISF